jgi:predicted dehydrogenase
VRLARYDDMAPEAKAASRVSAGHPEGYLLAFANLYREFSQGLMARALGRPYRHFLASLPTVDDGVRGMALIEAASLSNEREGAWVACRL